MPPELPAPSAQAGPDGRLARLRAPRQLVGPRLLLLAAVILGVLAMHGLTTAHGDLPTTQVSGHPVAEMTHAAATGAVVSAEPDPGDPGQHPAGASHHLGDICLAVLCGALAYAVMLAALQGRATVAGLHTRAAMSALLRLTRRRSPSSAPSLSALCLLRI